MYGFLVPLAVSLTRCSTASPRSTMSPPLTWTVQRSTCPSSRARPFSFATSHASEASRLSTTKSWQPSRRSTRATACRYFCSRATSSWDRNLGRYRKSRTSSKGRACSVTRCVTILRLLVRRTPPTNALLPMAPSALRVTLGCGLPAEHYTGVPEGDGER